MLYVLLQTDIKACIEDQKKGARYNEKTHRIFACVGIAFCVRMQ